MLILFEVMFRCLHFTHQAIVFQYGVDDGPLLFQQIDSINATDRNSILLLRTMEITFKCIKLPGTCQEEVLGGRLEISWYPVNRNEAADRRNIHRYVAASKSLCEVVKIIPPLRDLEHSSSTS
jgi:hypothetical protein